MNHQGGKFSLFKYVKNNENKMDLDLDRLILHIK